MSGAVSSHAEYGPHGGPSAPTGDRFCGSNRAVRSISVQDCACLSSTQAAMIICERSHGTAPNIPTGERGGHSMTTIRGRPHFVGHDRAVGIEGGFGKTAA